MEPLFFKAENPQDKPWDVHRGQTASMEPLFFKAENRPNRAGTAEAGICFNGAAFFQSGKFQQ